MLYLKDLFEKQGIKCPKWLLKVPLNDYWKDSEYVFEDNVHKWIYFNPITHVIYARILWDGEECRFEGYDETGEEIIGGSIITKYYGVDF